MECHALPIHRRDVATLDGPVQACGLQQGSSLGIALPMLTPLKVCLLLCLRIVEHWKPCCVYAKPEVQCLQRVGYFIEKFVPVRFPQSFGRRTPRRYDLVNIMRYNMRGARLQADS